MSPDSPDSQPILTPRVCLNSLPNEVKSRIAELCWLQDEWWREYSAYVEKQLDGTGYTELERFARETREEGDRFGASLGSLALVSQAWAELTAPFRFLVVRVAKSNRPIFRQRIAWRHLHHVRELHLDDSDMANFHQFLGYLPAFPNVKKVVIKNPTIAEFCRRSLFPSHWGLADEELLARIDLRHLFERIESLAYTIEPKHPTHVLSATALNLTSFALRFADATNGTAILSTVLSTAPHLSCLAIDAHGLDLDFAALRPAAGTSWPTLTSLSLEAERFNPSLEAFILHLTASLRHLRLEWTEEPAGSDDTNFAFPVSPAFPALRVLELVECGTLPLLPIIGSVKPSSLPSLGELTVVPHFDDEEDAGFAHSGISTALCALLKRFGSQGPTLRYYQSREPLSPWCMVTARDDFREYDDRLTMRPTTPFPHFAYYWPQYTRDCNDCTLFGEPIAKTMDFLASWVQRVESCDSPEEYAHLASALRFVELERVAQTS